MSPIELGAIIAAATALILLIGVPVAFALGGVAITALVWMEGLQGLDGIVDSFLRGLEDFSLVSVPFFVLMGVAATLSPAGGDLREMLKRWLHRYPGGLIAANLLASALFSGLSSTGAATCMAVGRDGLRELRERRYPDAVAAGATAAGGTLGILIPPSLAMIVYGIAADLSIGRLFLAGLVPGLVLTALFVFWAVFAARRWRGRRGDFARGYTRAESLTLLPRVIPFLALIAGVLIALWTGVATASETAAIAAIASIAMVAVVYGKWRPAALIEILCESTREAAAVLLLIAASILFGYMLDHFAITGAVVDAVASRGFAPWAVIVAVNLYLLVVGLFLPPVAVVLMSVPLLLPLVKGVGFDPYWFAVMMTVNLQIGLITPPVGLNLFVVRALAPEIPAATVLKGALPFILCMVAVIGLLYFFPEIATWLPDRLMGPA